MKKQSKAKKIILWEIAGFVFIVILGSSLHFAFEWSGKWLPLALVAAVNESVWEHLKLAFWPGIVWSLLEWRWLPLSSRSFWAVKGLALLIAPLAIVFIFYGYTAILGTNYLVLDISTFVLAVALSQYASARLLVGGIPHGAIYGFGYILLAVQIIAFSSFTYFPPDHPLFIETRSGIKGIPPVIK